MDLKTFTAKVQLHDGDEVGRVTAMFSVFDVRDDQGDVVLASFFKDGQEIPMTHWSHDWGSLPVGKGVIRVSDKGALFDGRFFMDTLTGQEHYKTVKNMGDLQEWSFGFNVEEDEERPYKGPDGKEDGVANYLVAGETFEATPTLVGANRNTHTVDIKAATEYGRLPLAEHGELVATVLDGYLKRVADRKTFRESNDRDLSEANREALREMQAGVEAIGQRVAELLQAAGADLDPARLYREFLRWESERVGVPT